MNNARFSTSLHILSLLAMSDGVLVSSDWIAGSMNVNPVVVRKELISLRNAGLVTTREGKNGGSTLAKPANKITLAEIYKAIKPQYVLGRQLEMPNPDCPIGRQINKHLDNLFDEIDASLLQKLEKKNLAAFTGQFK